MKDFKDLLGHTDIVEDDSDIVEFHIRKAVSNDKDDKRNYALCGHKDYLCVCNIQVVFNKMCKECITTLTSEELKDLKYYLVIRKLMK